MNCLCLLCFVCCSMAAAAESPRIVGGQEVTIELVPYLVNLRHRDVFICGGSLITSSCVLSAAHCVHGAQAQDFSVHAGASRLNENAPIVRDVNTFYVAPNYNPTNFDMDVAILRLSTPATRLPGQVTSIVPCSLPPPSNAYVRISGWGVTSEENRLPPSQVRTANVRVLPTRECQLAYAGLAKISDSMFCAAIRGVKDSCSGDSGGPVVYRGQVCGIVSWGFGCARAAFPGVYTSVASPRVQHFIQQTMQDYC
ncbi:seminase [Scaptodrosophila lebanonensis]|uniref:trypsin n=1 Tax=Drosophila lebanonensis TaxID=7225 RepID=A0A6J2UEY5_DROLE|nr:seminase [Scaptodrosophila lebanonensis]